MVRLEGRPHYCDNPPSEIVSLNIADIVILHENIYHHFMFSKNTVRDKKTTFSSVQSRAVLRGCGVCGDSCDTCGRKANQENDTSFQKKESVNGA